MKKVILAALLLLVCMSCNASAAVVVDWHSTDPHVIVPVGGSTTINASGVVTAGTLDAILVFDISGSMAFNTSPLQVAPNGGTQRGDWARDGALAFVDALPPNVRLGLTQFKGNTSLIAPLQALGDTSPKSQARSTLETAIASMPRNGTDGTNIENAINFAASLLNDPSLISDSKHIVVLTDGEQTTGSAVAATNQAIANGIDTVNTVGLPGADVAMLAAIANAGNGNFVNGTDLSNLIDGFASVLANAETFSSLDILDADGNLLLANISIDSNGVFTAPLEIFVGENIFQARVTSSLGNVDFATLNIQGFATVPEPASTGFLAAASSLFLLRRRWSRRKSKTS